MAPVEREARPGITDAVTEAERIVRAMAHPQRREAVPVRVLQSIESAERAMGDAKSAAQKISSMLGTRPAREAERGAVVSETRQEMGRFRERLDSLSREKTGIDQLDQRHDQFFANMRRTLDNASAALDRGDQQEAARLFATVRTGTDAFDAVLRTQKELASRNAPIAALLMSDRALELYLSGQTKRADLLLRACGHIASHSDLLQTTTTGTHTAQNLWRGAAALAGAPGRVEERELNAFETFLSGVETEASRARERMSEAVGLECSRLAGAAAPSSQLPQPFKASLRALLQDTEGITPERIGQMDNAQLASLAQRIMLARQAVSQLEAASGMGRDLAGKAYSLAMGALSEGNNARAEFYIFMAGELQSPAAAGEANRFRVLAGRHLDRALRAGSGAEAAEAEKGLKKMTAAMLSRQLEADAKSIGGVPGATLEGLSGPLARPEEATLAQLRAARDAANAAAAFSSRFRAARGLSEDERSSAHSMLERGLKAMIAGRDQLAASHFALVSVYLDRRSTALQQDDASRFSETLERNPAAVNSTGLYIELNNKALAARAAARRRPSGERAALNRIADRLEMLRAAIADNGGLALPEAEQVKVRELKARAERDENLKSAVEAFAARTRTEGESVEAAMERAYLSIAKEAAERDARADAAVYTGIADGLLSLKGDRTRRSASSELLGYALSAAESGRMSDASTFIAAAQTAGRLPPRDCEDLLSLCRSAHLSREEGQSAFSEPLMRSLAVYDAKSRLMPKVERQKRRNAEAFFDLTLHAARNVGNPEEFRVVMDIAATYAQLAAEDVRQLPADMRRQRTDAMARLERELGDYSWVGSKRLLDIGAAGRRGWTPPAGRITSPMASALLAGQPLSLSAAMVGEDERRELQASLAGRLGRQPTADELSDAAASRGWALLSQRASLCDGYGALLEEMGVERSHAALTGASSERHRASITRQYASERTRLERLAQQARRGGDGVLAGYYESRARRTDFGFVAESANRARDMHRRGMEQRALAVELGAEADNAPARSMADVNSRIQQLRSQLASHERAGLDSMLARAQGREPEIRRIHIGLLRTISRRNAEEAISLIQEAKTVLSGLGSYDQSVRRINSRSREDGRLEAYIGIRTLIAVRDGKDVNLFGEQVEGPLSAVRAGALRSHGNSLVAAGRNRIRIQQRMVQQRNSIIRQADRMMNANLQAAARVVRGMIAQLPEEARAGMTSKLEEILKVKDAGERTTRLQEHLKSVAEALQQRAAENRYAENTADLQSYDAAARHEQYRGVVGQAWAERFGSARRSLARANIRMRQDETLVNNRLADMRFHERRAEYNAVLNPDARACMEQAIADLVHDPGARRLFLEELGRTSDIRLLVFTVKFSQAYPGLDRYLADFAVNRSHDYRVDEVREAVQDSRARLERGDIRGAQAGLGRARSLMESGERLENARIDRITAAGMRRRLTVEEEQLVRDNTIEPPRPPEPQEASRLRQELVKMLEGSHPTAAALLDRENVTLTWRGLRAAISLVRREGRRRVQGLSAARRRQLSVAKHIGSFLVFGTPYVPARPFAPSAPHEKPWARKHRTALNGASRRYLLTPIAGSFARDRAQWENAEGAAQSHIDVLRSPGASQEAIDGARDASSTALSRARDMHNLESQSRHIATTAWHRVVRPNLEHASYAKQYRYGTRSYYSIFRSRELRTGGTSLVERVADSHIRLANEGITLIGTLLDARNSLGGYWALLSNDPLPTARPERSSFRGFHLGTHRPPEMRPSDILKRLLWFTTLETLAYAPPPEGKHDAYETGLPIFQKWAQMNVLATFRQFGVEPRDAVWESHAPGQYDRWVPPPDKTSMEAYTQAVTQFYTDFARIQNVLVYSPERHAVLGAWTVKETSELLNVMDKRMDMTYEGIILPALRGRLNPTVVGLYPGFLKSTDEKLKAAEGAIRDWQGYRGYAAIAIDFAAIGVTALTAPQFLPAVFFITGTKGVAEGIDMRIEEGRWTGQAIFATAMGAAGMILPFAGELAQAGAAARVAAGGQRAERLMTAGEAVQTGMRGSRLRVFMRASPERQAAMLQEAERASKAMAAGQMSRSQARRVLGRSSHFREYVVGTPAITGTQKAVHLAGHAVAFGAAGHFFYGLSDMRAAYRRGEMGRFDIFMAAFQGVFQPVATAGYAMRASTSTYAGTPRYMARWKQQFAAVFLGVPMQPRSVHIMARDHDRLTRELRKLPEPDRRQYNNFISRNNVELEPGRQVAVVRDYAAARAGEPGLTFRRYFSRQATPAAKELRIALWERAFQRAYWGGMQPRGSPELIAYIEARRNGVPAERAAELAAAQARAAAAHGEAPRAAGAEPAAAARPRRQMDRRAERLRAAVAPGERPRLRPAERRARIAGGVVRTPRSRRPPGSAEEATPIQSPSARRAADREAAARPRRPPDSAEEATPLLRPSLQRPSAQEMAPPRRGTLPGIGGAAAPRPAARRTAAPELQPRHAEDLARNLRNNMSLEDAIAEVRKSDPSQAKVLEDIVLPLSRDERYTSATPEERTRFVQETLASASRERPFENQLLQKVREGKALRDAVSEATQSIEPDRRTADQLAARYGRQIIMGMETAGLMGEYATATPQRRVEILQDYLRGLNRDRGFDAMVRGSIPDTSQSLIIYQNRWRSMPETVRTQRMNALSSADPGFAALLKSTLNTMGASNAKTKLRIADDWSGYIGARARFFEKQNAAERRTPDQRRAQETELIRKTARERGLDERATAELLDIYSSGTAHSRLAVLEKLGLDISSFRRAEQRILGAEDSTASMQRDIQQLDNAIGSFFDLILRSDLQSNLTALPEYAGARITGVEYHGGMTGAYGLRLSNGKRVFVKLESADGANIGRNLALARGMYTSKIWDGGRYNTGLELADGGAIRQNYSLFEDVRDAVGRRIDIVLPSGRRENVEVVAVRMSIDVMKIPKDPGPDATPEARRAYESELRAFTGDPLVKRLFGDLDSDAGRATLFRAWMAYHEMSRSIGLSDRFARNTAIMLVKRADGELVLTFQPIDMDAVGWKIGPGAVEGSYNYQDFHKGFANATIDLLDKFASAARGARSRGLMRNDVGRQALYTSMFSGDAVEGTRLPSGRKQQVAVETAVSGHDGQMFGLAIPEAHFNTVLETAWGGQFRLPMRMDYRRVWRKDDAIPLYRNLANPDRRQNFINDIRDHVRKEFTDIRLPSSEQQPSSRSGPGIPSEPASAPRPRRPSVSGGGATPLQRPSAPEAARQARSAEPSAGRPASEAPVVRAVNPPREASIPPIVRRAGRVSRPPPEEASSLGSAGPRAHVGRAFHTSIPEGAVQLTGSEANPMAVLGIALRHLGGLRESYQGGYRFGTDTYAAFRVGHGDDARIVLIRKPAAAPTAEVGVYYAEQLRAATRTAEAPPSAPLRQASALARPPPIPQDARKPAPPPPGGRMAPRPPPMSLEPNQAMTILGTPGDHPRLTAAQNSFLAMDRGGQLRTLQQLRAWASIHETNNRPGEAQQLRRRAARLEDLMELNGPVGQNIERMRNLRSGELQEIYSRAGGSVEEGRQAVCRRLNIEVSNYADDSIFAIMFSGDMVGIMNERHPGFKRVSIEAVGEGQTGAYRLTVIDRSDRQAVSYLKKVDMRPDRAGADNFLASSVPAPRTTTADSRGRPLLYRTENGTFSAYGIQDGITDFSGPLTRSGVRLEVDTVQAAPLHNMSSSPELMNILLKNPGLFWREWGYMQAAGWALGSIDGHAGNAFGMMLRIRNATPEVIARLRAAGETVFDGPGGQKHLFTIGRIDTDDAGGTYWAFGQKGNFNFTEAKVRNASHFVFPESLRRVLALRNAYETHVANAEGRPPRLMALPDMVREAFGQNGQGPVYDGIRKWTAQHINDPNYRRTIIDGMNRRIGEPIGVSSFSAGLLDPARNAQFRSDGVTYFNMPNNGEPVSPIFYRDGRTMAMPPHYNLVSGVNAWPVQVQNVFPQGQRVWVVPVSKRQSAGMPNLFTMGRKRFAVFSSQEAVPRELRARAMWAIRTHDDIRAQDGFGKATGIQVQEVGAGHVFDHIMNGGEAGMVREFRSMQNMLEIWANEQPSQ